MGVEKKIVLYRKNTKELVCNNCGEIFIYRCKNSKDLSYCSYCYKDVKRAREQRLEEEKQRVEGEKWRRQSMIDKERFEEQLRHISTIPIDKLSLCGRTLYILGNYSLNKNSC